MIRQPDEDHLILGLFDDQQDIVVDVVADMEMKPAALFEQMIATDALAIVVGRQFTPGDDVVPDIEDVVYETGEVDTGLRGKAPISERSLTAVPRVSLENLCAALNRSRWRRYPLHRIVLHSGIVTQILLKELSTRIRPIAHHAASTCGYNEAALEQNFERALASTHGETIKLRLFWVFTQVLLRHNN